MAVIPIPRGFTGFSPLSEERPASSLRDSPYFHTPAAVWTMKIFGLDELPLNFVDHYREYQEFCSYVSAKGDYTPDCRFLDRVLKLIQNNQFEVHRLQSLESALWDSFMFSGRCLPSIYNSSLHLKKSQQLGFYAEQESVEIPMTDAVAPTLQEFCFKALRKSSYPQAFISSAAFRKDSYA